MLTKRIIPCLDVRSGRVVKGINFEGLRDVDDPVTLARFYNDSGADELVPTTSPPAQAVTRCSRIAARRGGGRSSSLTVGGSINTLDDFDRVLKCGADKVSVNSGAIRDPSLIARAARLYGDQCVVLSMDLKRVGIASTSSPAAAGMTLGWTPSTGSAGAWTAARARWSSTPSTPTACAAALTWRCSGPWAMRCPCPSSPPAAPAAARIFWTYSGLAAWTRGWPPPSSTRARWDIRALKRWLNENGVPMRLVEESNDGL